VKRVNLKLLLGLSIALLILVGGVFGLHRYQVARNAGGLAKLARQRLKEGKAGEALGLFGRYLGMRPDDVEVQREYAELVLEQTATANASQADLQRAYNSLEEAVRRNPDDDELRLKLADFQVRVGRFSDAREHLETLRSRLGAQAAAGEADDGLDAVKIQLLLARAFAGEGDFDSSARLAADLIGYDVQQRAFDPDRRPVDDTDPYVLLAAILEERLDDPSAATTILEELGKRRSGDSVAWLALSRWHRQRGDLESATQDMDKAREIAPDDNNVIWGAFELALAKGDIAAAKAIATRARELFPADERVYRGLAALALQQNDLAAAEESLRDGTGQIPGKASLLLMLADTLLQQGKLDETDEVVAQIEELFGTSTPAVGLLQGRVLIARRRWPEARRRLEEIRPLAVGLDEMTRQIDLCLGQCYENLGEFDEQLDVSRRILVDDPTSLAARVAQASAMAAGGRNEEALAEFETVAAAIPAERLPTVPQVWYPLMQLRVMEQTKKPVGDRDWSRVDQLLTMLEESATVSASQIALLRADILTRKGEQEAALDLLERVSQAADAEPAVWSSYALLTLRERGPDAAREILARLPADRANHPALLSVRMQLAARAPPEESARELAALEEQAEKLPPEEAARLLSALGGVRLEMGEQAEAERLWRKAAERQADDLQSRTALLELAMKTGDVAKAKAAAADIDTVAGATSARARVAQAGVRILEVRQAQERKELETGKVDLTPEENRLLDEARNLLIEAENDRPGWHLIQTYSAEIDGLKGDIPAAIDRLQRAVRLGPANPDVVRQLVALLYATNRLEEARQALDLLGPDGLAGFERLSAEMELRSGRLDEAVAIAERSVGLDSKNGAELLWLAQLLERSGKRERAGELFAKAVEVSPDRADVWIALFNHQFTTGRRRAAENTLDRAAEALKSPARDLVLAQGSEMLGRLQDADQALRDATAAAPDDVGIATARAEFLIRTGRIDEAKQSLRDLVASPGDSAGPKAMKAWARRKLAELTAERGTYPQLLEALALIDGNLGADGRLANEDAAAKIALLANRPEPVSWQEAVAVLERLRDQQPLTTAQRLTLAGLLDKVGRWEESRQELMAIVSAPKTPPAFIAMLADKLITHDELDNARAWVKRLQDVAPQAPVTVALEARLAVAEKDRTRAADLARRLMPAGDVPTDQTAQLAALAQLLEDLEFPKAADKVLAQYAASSPDGVIARAQFLGRQGRTDEALDILEKSWDALSLERLVTVAVDALRWNPKADGAAARVQQWLTKARRIDADSVVLQLVEAELFSMQDRVADAESRYRELLARKNLEPMQAAIVSNNLAFHLAEPKTAAEAKKLIDAAIDTIGPHPDLLDTRGLVRLALGENRDAVADLEQATLQPTDVKLLHLAYARLRNGDKSAARTALEQGRKKGLTSERLTVADRARLRELEAALGMAPEQAGPDAAQPGRG
jgi:tetratricopeptide (TPR) repeat protein